MNKKPIKSLLAVVLIHLFLVSIIVNKKVQPFEINKQRISVQTIKLSPPKLEVVKSSSSKKTTSSTKPAEKKPAEKKSVSKKKTPQPSKKGNNPVNAAMIKKLREDISNFETTPPKHKSDAKLAVPKGITTLQIDQEISSQSHSIEEKYYCDSITSLLQSSLQLPESGAVKIEIEIDKEGKVKKLIFLHSDSKKNRDYLQERLPFLSFPKPAKNLSENKKLSYVLTLCNEI